MREHTPHGNTPFEPLLQERLRIALLALPRWFRCRWAADMRGMFRERLREAADSGGLRAAVATGSRELGSIAFAAFQSRFEQATGRVHRAREAQDGSDVWRTDPVPALFSAARPQGLEAGRPRSFGLPFRALHGRVARIRQPRTCRHPMIAVRRIIPSSSDRPSHRSSR